MMTGGVPLLLPRERLHRLLDRPEAPLSVLAAPSGFGKTSLVRSWVETVPCPVIWVSLEGDLVSRPAFWQSVLASATRLGVLDADLPLPAHAEDLDRSDLPGAVLAAALGEHVTTRGPVTLVIDAYERLREATAEVDADLLALVRDAPGLRVVVTTRGSTGLGSPGRSLRGDVQLIGAEELAFTESETAALVAAFAPGVAASPAQLHRATRGYPLALRAALLALGRARPSDRLPDADWQALVAEDLRGQLGSGPGAELVRATVVPPYFDEALAAELAGSTEVKQLLDDLAWNGFGRWIPFTPDRQVFQYVDALRDAMLADAAQQPAAERLRAAELSAWWLHRQGSHEAAFEVAVSHGLYGVAARVYALLVAGNQDAITSTLFDHHLAAVPSRALRQYPALAFGRGLACHRDPALRGAAGDFFRISAAWDGPRLSDPTPGEVLLGHLSKTVSLRLLGRFAQSHRAARAAEAFLAALPEADAEQLGEVRTLALRHLAYSHFQAGDLEAARSATARAVAGAGRPEVLNHTAVYAVGLSAVEGRTAEARAAMTLVDDEAWGPGERRTYVNALGRIGRATLLLDAFDLDGALAEYDGCESFLHTSEFWPFSTWTLMHARLGRGEAAAEARRVAELLRRTPPPPGMTPEPNGPRTADGQHQTGSLGAAAVRGALAVLWLAAGNRTKALPLLRGGGRHAGQLAPAVLLSRLLAGGSDDVLLGLPALEQRPGHTLRSTVAVLTLGAAAALRAGHEESALALLERALALSGVDGARAHLMYLPAADLAALRALADRADNGALRTYLTGLLPDCFPGSRAAVSLTTQERAVIAAMVLHSTRSAVAAALHVSENTVKTHLQRIYRKLGVNSRSAVIERAIELDLLGRG
ncbi:helix-turn-helix transcriptional regulator [Nocardioides faecalis]|nr:LuxR C-terminal-related transcriptional regulator [Nocardioides faecalis]